MMKNFSKLRKKHGLFLLGLMLCLILLGNSTTNAYQLYWKTTTPVGTYASAFIYDFNADGKDDLIVHYQTATHWHWRVHDGNNLDTILWRWKADHSKKQINIRWGTAFDIDGDGHPELPFTVWDFTSGDTQLRIYNPVQFTGRGLIVMSQRLRSYSGKVDVLKQPFSVNLFSPTPDFNNDQIEDLIIVENYQGGSSQKPTQLRIYVP